IDHAMLAEAARDPEHLEYLERVGLTSALTVPLAARGRTFGALTLAMTESGRHLAEEDLRFAEELARRAGLAIDNARLIEAERLAGQAAERAADRTARLQAVTAALSEALTSERVAEVIVSQALPALGADAGS